MTPTESLSITLLLQELDGTRLLLEKAVSSKKTDLQKIRMQVAEKIGTLERLKAELYGALSNLDYAYHQGHMPYDEYKTQMAALLKNKPLEHYVLKIDHLLQKCHAVQA